MAAVKWSRPSFLRVLVVLVTVGSFVCRVAPLRLPSYSRRKTTCKTFLQSIDRKSPKVTDPSFQPGRRVPDLSHLEPAKR